MCIRDRGGGAWSAARRVDADGERCAGCASHGVYMVCFLWIHLLFSDCAAQSQPAVGAVGPRVADRGGGPRAVRRVRR
eukprot:5493684-Prymnesium_polylepis.1